MLLFTIHEQFLFIWIILSLGMNSFYGYVCVGGEVSRKKYVYVIDHI